VEDEAGFRMMMADSLLDAGFEVVEAENGDEAVNILKHHAKIDLLVTDIRMPGRYDGNEVAGCAKISYSGLPVVYVSGSPESLINPIGPSDAFFAKPFRVSEMIIAIDRFARWRRSARTLLSRLPGRWLAQGLDYLATLRSRLPQPSRCGCRMLWVVAPRWTFPILPRLNRHNSRQP
jgi:CheY-like chemotaxis protein